MRKKIVAGVLGGLCVITVGIILLGNTLSLWNINLLFKGFWTLFLIVPALISMCAKGYNIWDAIALMFGVSFLLVSQEVIKYMDIYRLMMPVLLILIGITIIIRYFLSLSLNKFKHISKGEMPSYSAVFAGICNAETEFYGANCDAVFGSLTIDLSSVNFTEDVLINSCSVFGAINLKLPDNVKLKVISTDIFGGVENHKKGKAEKNAPTLYVNATCLFGGVNIK